MQKFIKTYPWIDKQFKNYLSLLIKEFDKNETSYERKLEIKTLLDVYQQEINEIKDNSPCMKKLRSLINRYFGIIKNRQFSKRHGTFLPVKQLIPSRFRNVNNSARTAITAKSDDIRYFPNIIRELSNEIKAGTKNSLNQFDITYINQATQKFLSMHNNGNDEIILLRDSLSAINELNSLIPDNGNGKKTVEKCKSAISKILEKMEKNARKHNEWLYGGYRNEPSIHDLPSPREPKSNDVMTIGQISKRDESIDRILNSDLKRGEKILYLKKLAKHREKEGDIEGARRAKYAENYARNMVNPEDRFLPSVSRSLKAGTGAAGRAFKNAGSSAWQKTKNALKQEARRYMTTSQYFHSLVDKWKEDIAGVERVNRIFHEKYYDERLDNDIAEAKAAVEGFEVMLAGFEEELREENPERTEEMMEERWQEINDEAMKVGKIVDDLVAESEKIAQELGVDKLEYHKAFHGGGRIITKTYGRKALKYSYKTLKGIGKASLALGKGGFKLGKGLARGFSKKIGGPLLDGLGGFADALTSPLSSLGGSLGEIFSRLAIILYITIAVYIMFMLKGSFENYAASSNVMIGGFGTTFIILYSILAVEVIQFDASYHMKMAREWIKRQAFGVSGYMGAKATIIGDKMRDVGDRIDDRVSSSWEWRNEDYKRERMRRREEEKEIKEKSEKERKLKAAMKKAGEKVKNAGRKLKGFGAKIKSKFKKQKEEETKEEKDEEAGGDES